MVMAGTNFAVLLMCMSALLLVNAQPASPAAADCSVPFSNLAPCLDYVNSNSSASPSQPCCTAFATTQAQEPVCLCQLQQAFADPATARGNVTRAAAIPTLCKVTVDYTKCPALLGTPIPAPAPSTPVHKPTPAPAPAPASHAPNPSPAFHAPNPAPAPKGSDYNCTDAFNLLTPCVIFVTGDGSGAPPKDCCTSLGTVQSQEPVCLCQLLAQVSNSSQYGVNATLAESLPKLCSVAADTSKCPALLGDILPPNPAPVTVPAAAPVVNPSAPVAAPVVNPSAPVAAPVAASSPGPAGSTVDCSNEFTSLQSCFAYVTGNDTTPPSASCCSALGTVVTNKLVCLCQLLQTVGSGDPATSGINATRALELPSVCKVNSDVSKCPALLGQPVASPTGAPAPVSVASPSSSSTLPGSASPSADGGSEGSPASGPAPSRAMASRCVSFSKLGGVVFLAFVVLNF